MVSYKISYVFNLVNFWIVENIIISKKFNDDIRNFGEFLIMEVCFFGWVRFEC